MREFWSEHGLPFLFWIAVLALAALGIDWLLHLADLVWIGRYLGIPGTLLILLSLLYSMRKRGRIVSGSQLGWLRWHEAAAWLGSLLVLVHAGLHFNAVLPWLATLAMGINVISGLAGRYLLRHAREHLSPRAGETATLAELLTLDLLLRWRQVHLTIFVVFSVLALGHIFAIFLFWGWR